MSIPTDPVAMAALVQRQADIAEGLQRDDPTLPDVTAVIMAGDILSGERADVMLTAGAPFVMALHAVGSYARLDWALRHQEAGAVTRTALLEMLPDLWRGSDPDDTDPRFLALWREAWAAGGRRTILDRDPLPAERVSGPGGRKYYRVFRGQEDGARIGIAWSLDRAVAERFAKGAGLRAPTKNPVVYEARIHHRAVLAYLTMRGEAEVVVNPGDLR